MRGAELRAAAAAAAHAAERRTRAVLQMLGDHFTSPVFTAALELWVAARTDPALLAAVAPLEQRVGRETHRLTVELLGADESPPGVRELVQATLDLVRGLGLANTITDDARRRGRILDQWARTLDAALKATAMTTNPAREPCSPTSTAEGDQLSTRSSPASTRRAGGRRPRPRAGTSPPRSPTCSGPTRPPRSPRPTDKEAWDALVLEAIADPDGLRRRRRSHGGRRLTPQALLARWGPRARGAGDGAARAARRARRCRGSARRCRPTSMATARFMETWAHALDVLRRRSAIEPEADRPDPARRPPRRPHPRLRLRRARLDAAGRGVPGRADRSLGRDLDLGPGGRRADA